MQGLLQTQGTASDEIKTTKIKTIKTIGENF